MKAKFDKQNLNVTNVEIPEIYYGFIFITYFPDGHIYVGQTDRRVHKKYFGSGGKDLRQAKLDQGEQNLKREILRFCRDFRDLNNWETVLIAKFKATNKEVGYNILPGPTNLKKQNPMKFSEVVERQSLAFKEWYKTEDGIEQRKRASILHKDKIVSEETRLKMSSSAKIKPSCTVETRIKIGLKSKGNKHTLGRKATDEERKNLSEKTSGQNNPMSETNRLKRKILKEYLEVIIDFINEYVKDQS